MATPFLLVQISDPHIGATWAGGDPAARLAAAIEEVQRLPERPDAVLISGDLADNAAAAEYEVVRELVARFDAPTYVLPGNHDDRNTMRGCFELPGSDGAPIQYAVELGPLRLVVLDSTRPGEDPGELDRERLAWLEAQLAADPDRPTIVAMHHPPPVPPSPLGDGQQRLGRDRPAERGSGRTRRDRRATSAGAPDRRRPPTPDDRGGARPPSGARGSQHLRAGAPGRLLRRDQLHRCAVCVRHARPDGRRAHVARPA